MMVVAAVLILAALGGGYYLYSKQGTTGTPQNSSQESGNKTSGKFWDLLKAGKNQECTFSSSTNDMTAKGTIFVSSDKVRGDFDSTVGGQKMTSYMIKDGDYIYIWTSGSNQGTKMKFDQVEQTDQSGSQSGTPQQTQTFNQNYEYDCKSWNPDNSKFTPPSNIQFLDINAQMDQAKNTVKGACSSCDSLSGEAKDSCRKALSC